MTLEQNELVALAHEQVKGVNDLILAMMESPNDVTGAMLGIIYDATERVCDDLEKALRETA